MEIVTAADFQRKIGLFQDRALTEPIMVTRNGRQRLVLLSAEEFHRLKRYDRRALSVDELSAGEIAAIEAATVPAEYAHLDEELKS